MRKSIQQGFTLIEMIVVIVITGIIAGIVAIFIQAPVQGYVDSARRADLTDIADTAVRRVARDVRMAVPNSVRLSGACPACAIEYIPTKDGGRYRAVLDNLGAGDVLVFGAADSSFDIVGGGIDFAAGDFIVVGSRESTATWPYDQTATGVLRAYNGGAGVQTNVAITNAVGLRVEAELDSQRFDVVNGAEQAVTYACEGVGTDAAGNGTGRLVRYWGYGFDHAYTVADPNADLADRVSACTMTYDIANQRFGLVTISLTLTRENESVSLYNEIHVNNAP
ncbi:MAG: prepilin-type N-terminal cleavage/methylation domain-containing protein [Gammaproteobacteria bacterium]|nr:prepilin-type N-terminal cleavage/methylation domain-containing protein [Sideroxydans sp.]MBU3903828.1 prepilin-type N-terminal cleavage/methylation domain-containing protein [Gammaproteobacteria bacterium]MBU4046339.1 prepilin-type N-terminal cleavage/methylation domain-containing protein [Gammaproteobacteria bacterium]